MKFGRCEIIKERKNFKSINKRGTKFNGKVLQCLVVRSEPNEVGGKFKVVIGISVGRSVRLAVDRNRIKRLIREACRKNQDRIKLFSEQKLYTTSLLFTYQKKHGTNFKLPTFCEVENDMQNILTQIF